jgi:hypothetical protein
MKVAFDETVETSPDAAWIVATFELGQQVDSSRNCHGPRPQYGMRHALIDISA